MGGSPSRIGNSTACPAYQAASGVATDPYGGFRIVPPDCSEHMPRAKGYLGAIAKLNVRVISPLPNICRVHVWPRNVIGVSSADARRRQPEGQRFGKAAWGRRRARWLLSEREEHSGRACPFHSRPFSSRHGRQQIGLARRRRREMHETRILRSSSESQIRSFVAWLGFGLVEYRGCIHSVSNCSTVRLQFYRGKRWATSGKHRKLSLGDCVLGSSSASLSGVRTWPLGR